MSKNLRANISNVAGLTIEIPARKELPNVDQKASISAAQGKGRDTTVKPGSSGGGTIATPLTEQSRTYHADKIATSSDGLFTFHYANVNEINFTDANSKPIKLVFSNP